MISFLGRMLSRRKIGAVSPPPPVAVLRHTILHFGLTLN